MKIQNLNKHILLTVLVFLVWVIITACVNQNNQQNSPKDALKFVESIDITHQVISVNSDKLIITNKFIDCYKDEQDNLFYFIPNTDIQCGYSKKYYYGFHEENSISIENAISVANTYLCKNVENFNDYAIIHSEHSISDAVYHIQYSYTINDVATQDLIDIYIQENGEIGAYLMPHMNMFKDINIEDNLISSIPIEGELLHEYITINEEGIILVRYLNIVNDSGQLESATKSYLLSAN